MSKSIMEMMTSEPSIIFQPDVKYASRPYTIPAVITCKRQILFLWINISVALNLQCELPKSSKRSKFHENSVVHMSLILQIIAEETQKCSTHEIIY
jgi:hypothetical protein